MLSSSSFDDDDDAKMVNVVGKNNNNNNDNNNNNNNNIALRTMFLLARENNWDELILKLHNLPPNIIRDAVEEEEESVVEVVEDEDEEEGEDVIDDVFSSRRNILHVVFQSCGSHHYQQQQQQQQYNNLLPIEVVQTIIKVCKELVNKVDINQQTPLHVAVQRMPDRTDIIKILIDADSPTIVYQQDNISEKPIDIVCQKIIMLEEYSKYHHKRNNQKTSELELIHVWDTVKVLAQAQAAAASIISSSLSTTTTLCTNNNINNDDNDQQQQQQQVHIIQEQPMITACLLAKDFPFALTDRAMKRYKHQLLDEPNIEGNLPLHAIASMSPPTTSPPNHNNETEEDNDHQDDEEDDEEEDNDYLERVLWLCPGAASKRNKQNHTPLMLAINTGHRRWDSGIFQLLKAHPSGLHDLCIPLQLYPNVLERIGSNNNINQEEDGNNNGILSTMIYSILHSRPEIFFGDDNNNNKTQDKN